MIYANYKLKKEKLNSCNLIFHRNSTLSFCSRYEKMKAFFHKCLNLCINIYTTKEDMLTLGPNCTFLIQKYTLQTLTDFFL